MDRTENFNHNREHGIELGFNNSFKEIEERMWYGEEEPNDTENANYFAVAAEVAHSNQVDIEAHAERELVEDHHHYNIPLTARKKRVTSSLSNQMLLKCINGIDDLAQRGEILQLSSHVSRSVCRTERRKNRN